MEDRIAALESRLATMADELAIIRILASYGPKVDCGLPGPATRLFGPGAVFDSDLGLLEGNQAYHDMLADPVSQGRVETGIGHVMGLPVVTLDGDRATAVNPTMVFTRDGEGYKVWRVAQNVWEFERIGGEWKIVRRTNRLVGSDDLARALLEGAPGIG